jgi:FO synthase
MAVLELTPIDRALERLAEGRTPDAAEATALLSTPTERLPVLLDAAAALRDRGRGRRITFSAKVFIPLTTLCRDYCGYCTFRKDPGEPGAFTMSPDQVLALARAGARLGAKEALFSLGDKPEALFNRKSVV